MQVPRQAKKRWEGEDVFEALVCPDGECRVNLKIRRHE